MLELEDALVRMVKIDENRAKDKSTPLRKEGNSGGGVGNDNMLGSVVG
jgi:hypothetical protein